jgi:hypothetical protein
MVTQSNYSSRSPIFFGKILFLEKLGNKDMLVFACGSAIHLTTLGKYQSQLTGLVDYPMYEQRSTLVT